MKSKATRLFPNTIRKIAVVAPAGAAPIERARLTAEWLRRSGIDVVLGPSVDARSPFSYLAAAAELRAADLHAAWRDPSVDLIISLRGGYGSAQLIPLLDWQLLSSRRVPFLGYSDLTALHLAMHAKGVRALVSGPMFSHLDKLRADPYTTASMHQALVSDREHRDVRPPAGRKPFTLLKAGEASGSLIPVTLSVLSSMLGTAFVPDLTGSILLVEDVGEPVYKLDRYFTQLRLAGILERLGGLLLGDFTRCGRVGERLRLFREVASWVNGPVLAGVPFGHCQPRISAVFGAEASISPDGSLRIT